MLEIASVAIADLSPLALLLLFVAAFATATFHAVSGFAGGVLLSVLIAPVLGVTAVVPVMAVVQLISASSRLWVFRRFIDCRIYSVIIIPALPGIAAGALVYGSLSPAAIAGVLGTFLIATVPLRRILEKRNFRVSPFGLAIVGAVFGLLSGTTIGAGLILVPFLLGFGIVGQAPRNKPA